MTGLLDTTPRRRIGRLIRRAAVTFAVTLVAVVTLSNSEGRLFGDQVLPASWWVMAVETTPARVETAPSDRAAQLRLETAQRNWNASMSPLQRRLEARRRDSVDRLLREAPETAQAPAAQPTPPSPAQLRRREAQRERAAEARRRQRDEAARGAVRDSLEAAQPDSAPAPPTTEDFGEGQGSVGFCQDGTLSDSVGRSGACSWHGGVK